MLEDILLVFLFLHTLLGRGDDMVERKQKILCVGLLIVSIIAGNYAGEKAWFGKMLFPQTMQIGRQPSRQVCTALFPMLGLGASRVRQENLSLLQMQRENEIAGKQGVEIGQEEEKEHQRNVDTEKETEIAKEVPVEARSNEVVGGQEAINKEKQVEYPLDKLRDFDFLLQKFYQVDSSTTVSSDIINVDKLMEQSQAISKSEEPQILIYHTHASEGYVNSDSGNPNTLVVGVGEQLKVLLEQRGWHVLHHTGVYDGNRDKAYGAAAPALIQLLEDHPSIQMVIDLHRDGVPETSHLVTEVNGVRMAQIMFFNGICRDSNGNPTQLTNPYLEDNLALSFHMQKAAMEYYPGFTRRAYLKAYRYNMNYCPKSMLIEVGAQNNTLEEALNAMTPLADLLDKVLSGE